MPCELIHFDVKSWPRSELAAAGHRMTGSRQSQSKVGPRRSGATGWEYVHVAMDNCTRLACVEAPPDEKAITVTPNTQPSAIRPRRSPQHTNQAHWDLQLAQPPSSPNRQIDSRDVPSLI
jgi:hypothetical protein